MTAKCLPIAVQLFSVDERQVDTFIKTGHTMPLMGWNWNFQWFGRYAILLFWDNMTMIHCLKSNHRSATPFCPQPLYPMSEWRSQQCSAGWWMPGDFVVCVCQEYVNTSLSSSLQVHGAYIRSYYRVKVVRESCVMEHNSAPPLFVQIYLHL